MPIDYIPRPKNPFIFFRSYYYKHPAEFLGASSQPHKDQNSVSRVAGAIWQTLSDCERAPYVEEARLERERYKREYPDYRYGSNGGVKPRRRASVTKNRKRDREAPPHRVIAPPPPSSPSSSSASPLLRTPSPVPEPERCEPDLHPDYTIGAEFTFPSMDWEAELDQWATTPPVTVKEEWDTYVSPFFPLQDEVRPYSLAPFSNSVSSDEYTFFHEPTIQVKVEEEDVCC
ncbi:hypothetical protein CPB85DRAFT_1431286 [Mucidula mucida]|nr:hypothetical protein CPB85DRAFT_1431286 [Mucidula mucida]